MTDLIADFPEKLGFLFKPSRYKVAYGGRSSSKSWSFARALLILGLKHKLRVLCAREVQDSLKQSVHKLLKDQVQRLGLGKFYRVLDSEIRGLNGTEFSFAGLSSLTVESIKSYEGCTHVWVEEGQTISDDSWVILIPTIRADDSEIWISFNPDLETDPTYDRFITNPPPGTVSAEVNWRDNPWFNDVMEQERQHCLDTDPEGYKNIWDGKCKPAVAGAIYYNEVQAIENDRRIMNIPYDPMLKVHLVFDLGFDDSLSVGFVQVNLSEVRIINYLEYTLTTLDTLSADLKEMRLNWGQIWLPHDGFNKTLNAAGKSTADILEALGWEVKPKEDITIVGIEDGIRIARMVLKRCYFDKEKTAAKLDPKPLKGQTLLTHRLIECLKRYRRKVNQQTGLAGSPLHDEHCLPAGEIVSTERGRVKIEDVLVGDKVELPGNMFGKVIKSGATKLTKELMEITCKDGACVRLTPNHTVLTNKGLVMASDLLYDHLILKSGGALWTMLKLFSRAEHTGLRETITRVMTSGAARPGACIETFGLKHMVRYLKVMLSTIKMRTSSTTISPTLSLCPDLNIVDYMPRRIQPGLVVKGIYRRFCQPQESSHIYPEGSQRIGQGTQSDGNQTLSCTSGSDQMEPRRHFLKPEMRHQNGMGVKKVERGTEHKQRKTGRIESLWKKCAPSAVKSILRFSPLVQSSATKIVRLRRYDVEEQPVYNLTVENHHCYIAGGLLVSNSHGSDLVRYIALNVDNMSNEATWDGYEEEREDYENQFDTCDSVTGY